MSFSDPLTASLRRIVNKRLTLNLLIQGAATHGCWAAHHLVADSLRELDPEFLSAYDRLGARLSLSYWRGIMPLISGVRDRYWKRIDRTQNVFSFHPFILAHGRELAVHARDVAFRRCREKDISTSGTRNEIGLIRSLFKTLEMEKPHQNQLERLACAACHQIYDVPIAVSYTHLTLPTKA